VVTKILEKHSAFTFYVNTDCHTLDHTILSEDLWCDNQLNELKGEICFYMRCDATRFRCLYYYDRIDRHGKTTMGA